LPESLQQAGSMAWLDEELEPELPELERQLISRTLEMVEGQRQAAAEILGISLDELDLKIRSYGLEKG
jgi:DNA-binding NtrC family response regulator